MGAFGLGGMAAAAFSWPLLGFGACDGASRPGGEHVFAPLGFRRAPVADEEKMSAQVGWVAVAAPAGQYKRVLEYLSRYGIRYCSGGYTKTAPFLGTRPNNSESHSEISRVPFCIAVPHQSPAQLRRQARAAWGGLRRGGRSLSLRLRERRRRRSFNLIVVDMREPARLAAA